MAYIIGLTTKEERDTLRNRGWELEKAPTELIPEEDNAEDYIMVWVDASVIGIMSGPDWDKSTL